MIRRRRLRLAGALLLVAALGLGTGNAIAVAGTRTAAAPGAAAAGLGGFQLTSRANGVRVLYDVPGVLAIGTIFETTTPEAQTSLSGGPRGTALSSLGYPGPVVAGGAALLAQAGIPIPVPDLPPYPIVANASTGGPTEVRDEQTVPGGVMYAKAEGAEAIADTTGPANSSAPILDFGSVHATSHSVAGDVADTTSSVTMSDIDLLGGILHIDSITTQLHAVSDATTASSEGRTAFSGATFLGLPVIIDATGVHFATPPQTSPLGPLGQILGGNPVENAVALLLSQYGQLNTILNQAGFTIRLGEPREVLNGAVVNRVTEGLTIEMQQQLGSTPLAALFALVPQVPNPPGSPIGLNDLIAIIQARQVSAISIGRAEVSAGATPPFVLPPFSRPTVPPVTLPPLTPGSFTPPSSGGAPTFAPSTPVTSAPSAPVATVPTAQSTGLPLSGTGGIAAVILAGLGALVLTLGTRKLPDWALDGDVVAGAAACDLLPDEHSEDG